MQQRANQAVKRTAEKAPPPLTLLLYFLKQSKTNMKKILIACVLTICVIMLSFAPISNAGMVDKILKGATKIFKGTKKAKKLKSKDLKKADIIKKSKPSKIVHPNRQPVNSKYAGKKFPVDELPYALQKKYPESVYFDKNGYPDFSPYAKTSVKVKGLNGNYANDFTLANKNAGFDRTPDGYTWHHHQDGKLCC